MSAVATRPRLGFLGVGWIGRQRLEAIERSGVADIAAVADPAVEGLLASLDELLEAELDGVVIATPSALHAEQTLAALDRGLAVFCQKPLALDAATARRIVGVARERDLLLGVDFSYRETEAALRVREAVAELGDIYAVDLAFHNAYGPDKGWARNPALAGGGCLLDLGIHLVDLALWTLGFPRVEHVASTVHGRPIERYASGHIELETGAVLRLACSWWLHAGRDCAIEASFYGEHGGASLRNVDGSFYDFVAERFEGTARRTLAAPPDDWSGRAATAWARRLAAGEGFDPAAEQLVAVHDCLDRIYRRAL